MYYLNVYLIVYNTGKKAKYLHSVVKIPHIMYGLSVKVINRTVEIEPKALVYDPAVGQYSLYVDTDASIIDIDLYVADGWIEVKTNPFL